LRPRSKSFTPTFEPAGPASLQLAVRKPWRRVVVPPTSRIPNPNYGWIRVPNPRVEEQFSSQRNRFDRPASTGKRTSYLVNGIISSSKAAPVHEYFHRSQFRSR
jgi:hypothetical protein